MTVAHDDARPAGHTRWGRFAVAFVLPMVAAGVVASSLLNGVLAANLSVGGVPIELSMPRLQGESLGAFGASAPALDGERQVATTGIGNAVIDGGLCAAIDVPLPLVGGFTILIDAPEGRQITATSMVLDVSDLDADLTATELVIGRDASVLTEGGVKGPAGTNGIQSDLVTLENVEGTAYSLSAGALTVDGLSLDVAAAGTRC
ncbi:MAG TPA: DUF6230 family protein [Pseudonocardiaceae bacterium]